MSSVAEWDAFAGAAGIAFLLAALRLRADLGDPVHAVPFSIALVAGLVLVLGGISPPDLEARLLRFRLSPVGKAVEWSASVSLAALTWVALDRPLVALALGLAVAFAWTRKEGYYDELRVEERRLAEREQSTSSDPS